MTKKKARPVLHRANRHAFCTGLLRGLLGGDGEGGIHLGGLDVDDAAREAALAKCFNARESVNAFAVVIKRTASAAINLRSLAVLHAVDLHRGDGLSRFIQKPAELKQVLRAADSIKRHRRLDGSKVGASAAGTHQFELGGRLHSGHLLSLGGREGGGQNLKLLADGIGGRLDLVVGQIADGRLRAVAALCQLRLRPAVVG